MIVVAISKYGIPASLHTVPDVRKIINVKGASGGSYFCSGQEAMNDYGMSYDQVRHYLKQGKIQSQVISGDLKFERDRFKEAAHINDRTPRTAEL